MQAPHPPSPHPNLVPVRPTFGPILTTETVLLSYCMTYSNSAGMSVELFLDLDLPQLPMQLLYYYGVVVMQLLLLWVCIIITHANLETVKMHLNDYNKSLRLNKRLLPVKMFITNRLFMQGSHISSFIGLKFIKHKCILIQHTVFYKLWANKMFTNKFLWIHVFYTKHNFTRMHASLSVKFDD